MQLHKSLFGVLFATALAACGGGGSAAQTPTPTPAPTPAPTPSPTPIPTPTPIPSIGSCTTLSTTTPPAPGSSGLAFCASLMSDPDGDGTGTENGQSCQMRTGFDIAKGMGHGWNLGNTMDATGNKQDPMGDETYWGNPRTTKATIDAVKKAGFNTMRLPVSWDDHVSGTARTIDPAWMDRVEEIAKYALDNGMYVIVNIHHNDGWEAPTLANEANASEILVKLWRQIAERFKKYDHHVIFEAMNEPRVAVNGVDDWWGKQEYFDVVNRLNGSALSAIRASGGSNAKRLVMLPSYVAGPNDFQIDAVVLPQDKMIALSTHAYSPYEFALRQAGTSTFSGQAEIDTMFDRLNKKFILKGVPVIMGEWASTNKNNMAERVKHARYFVAGAMRVGIPTLWWDNGNSNYSAASSDIMGLLDRRTNNWVYPELVDAIMCPAK